MSKAGIHANLLRLFNPLADPLGRCKYVSALQFEKNGDSIWYMDYVLAK